MKSVKQQVKGQVLDQVINEAWPQLNRQVWIRVKDQVWGKGRDKFQVPYQTCLLILYQVKHHVSNLISDQVASWWKLVVKVKE